MKNLEQTPVIGVNVSESYNLYLGRVATAKAIKAATKASPRWQHIRRHAEINGQKYMRLSELQSAYNSKSCSCHSCNPFKAVRLVEEIKERQLKERKRKRK